MFKWMSMCSLLCSMIFVQYYECYCTSFFGTQCRLLLLRIVWKYGFEFPDHFMLKLWPWRSLLSLITVLLSLLYNYIPGMEPIMTPLVWERISCSESVTATTRISYVVPDCSPVTVIQFHSVSTTLRFHCCTSTPVHHQLYWRFTTSYFNTRLLVVSGALWLGFKG